MPVRAESARLQPFPFAALPAISRVELQAGARLRETARRFVHADRVAAALTELVGAPVSLSVRRTRPLVGGGASTDGIAVAFSLPEEGGLWAVLIDVERSLAVALVARALRQRVPRVVDTSAAPSPELAGLLAALLAAALRRVHAEAPLRVVAAGPATALTRDFAATHGSALTAWLTASYGGDAYDARISVPESVLVSTRPRSLGQEDLMQLGEVPVAVPLVVAGCISDRRTLDSLRAGDAFVLPACALSTEGDELVGPAALVAPTAERGQRATLGAGGRLVLGSGPLENHPLDLPPREAMSGEQNPTLQVVEDAPLVVRAELGAVTMTAKEWALLAPGDVITLARKLGDPVCLRVGGVEVARGELVQVDGEYGVRILPRDIGARG